MKRAKENIIKELRQLIHQLLSSYQPLSDTENQRLQEWIADRKQQLMHHLSNTTAIVTLGGTTNEQLTECLLALGRLSNRIYRSGKTGKNSHPQRTELLSLIQSGLHELIHYAEFECTNFFPQSIPIPDALLDIRLPAIKSSGESALQVLAKHPLSPGLQTVLHRYLTEFASRKMMTFVEEAYFKKICASIHEWLNRPVADKVEITLARMLCYFNFNRMDYLDLLRREYDELVHSSDSHEVRKARLQRELAVRKTFLCSPSWAYHPNRPNTVYQYAIDLLENALYLLEHEQYTGTPRTSHYLHFTFEQGTWSVLLDILMEQQLFGPKTSRRKAAYFLAEHFRTQDNVPLNGDFLRRAEYPHTEDDVKAFGAFIINCLAWLREHYPHLFF